MSYKETRQVLNVLNTKLHARYEEGDPLRLNLEGRPKLHILSFDPVAYEEYGVVRNRAKHMAGSYVLRTFLATIDPDGAATIIAGVEVGSEGYGFEMDFGDDNTCLAINGVAQLLGHPDFRITPV